jgi:hypothetical protein
MKILYFLALVLMGVGLFISLPAAFEWIGIVSSRISPSSAQVQSVFTQCAIGGLFTSAGTGLWKTASSFVSHNTTNTTNNNMTNHDKSIRVEGYLKNVVVGHRNELTNSFNYAPQERSLAQAAAEIQQLLEQLDKSYPTNTTTEKMAVATEAIKQIERDQALSSQVLSALKAGGVSAFAQLLNHPAASFLIAALEDWQKNKKS